jgi:hypothetical protein
MRTLSTLSFALLATTSAFALAQTAGLAWSVPEGTTLRREIITKQFLATESMTFRQGDETTVSQRIFDLSSTTTVRTSDQLRKQGAGRPAVLRRFYDEARVEAKSEVSGGRQQTQSIDLPGRSAFQGKSVVFTYVPEDDEYGRYFDTLEGYENTLAGLREDLGMRSLLPQEVVSEGAEWKLAPGVLQDVLAPGGDLSYEFEGTKDPLIARSLKQGIGANLHRAFGGEESGEVKAKWSRTDDVEGRKLAVITLEFKVQLARDLTDYTNSLRAVSELASGQNTIEARISLALEGGGEVRWDLENGCLFDTKGLRANQKLNFKRVVEQPTQEGAVRNEQILEMTGSVVQECSVSVER